MVVTTAIKFYDWMPLLDVTRQAVLSEKWKITAVKKLATNKRYLKTFNGLGNAELNSEQYKQLEDFVCCLYGRSKYKSVNTLRHDLYLEKSNVI